MRLDVLAVLALMSAASFGHEPDAALGGETSVPHTGINAFSQPAANISEQELREFFVGNSFFKRNWVQAPASAAARDGLGPRFNARSCSSCHLLDGRGGSPISSQSGFVVRLDPADGSHNIGTQLQDRAIPGVVPEGFLIINRSSDHGSDAFWSDGLQVDMQKPRFAISISAQDGTQNAATIIEEVSVRIGPQLIGLGLLEAIPANEIIAGADPDDENDDGISGRVNIVLNHRTGQMELGRFGWKAGMPDVANQVAMALWQDMGITNPLHPEQNCNRDDAACVDSPSGGSPEIAENLFDALVFYTRVLAPPMAREDADFGAGFRVFQEIGCADCHRPHWRTADDFEIEALAGQSIWPFTDLLLHDMGPQLADPVTEGQAAGSEWRTPPLWGLGLVRELNPETGYLHDGRAMSIEEAILWHAGEAEQSRIRFTGLKRQERAWLISFLESL